MPLFGRCIICKKRMPRRGMESCFHPITGEWLGLKRIHWNCYVRVYSQQFKEFASQANEKEPKEYPK